MTDIFDPSVAWADLEASVASTAAPSPERGVVRRHEFYKPLADAADTFVREAQDSRRIYTGIPRFDAEMRGIGAGHLCVIVGYSHSGKTQLLLHWLRSNREKRIVMYEPDEPATLTLTKLTAVTSGVGAKELEARVAEGDRSAIDLLRATALDEFPNLAVFDKPLTPNLMERGYDEVCDVWGAAPELVVVDYVDLVQAGETAQSKLDYIKGFGSRHEVPMIAIHQTSRSAGAEGRAMTISSGNYGGEQHATFMVGVRRKKSALQAELAEQRQRWERGSEAAHDRIQELEHDLRIHEYTITANLVKNKRPGGGLIDDLDFELDTETGRIYPLDVGDLPGQYQQRIASLRSAPTDPRPAQPSGEATTFFDGEF